jgi:hypothetical protein
MNKTSWIVTAALIGVSSMSAQDAPARKLTLSPAGSSGLDEDVKLLRKDLRSIKKQVIAANLSLADAEAEKFWPIYDRYTAELATITDTKYALLTEYAQNYDTLTGEQAESYIKGRAAVDESIMQLRLKYVPVFRKVLSGRSTALFFQIEWRLGLIMDLQLASQTPLIEQ